MRARKIGKAIGRGVGRAMDQSKFKVPSLAQSPSQRAITKFPGGMTVQHAQRSGGLRFGKSIPSYKKGGMVKKTGLAKLHKGEKVMTKDQVKKSVRKTMGY